MQELQEGCPIPSKQERYIQQMKSMRHLQKSWHMTDSYNVGYSVDALGDLREIYSYVRMNFLFRRQP